MCQRCWDEKSLPDAWRIASVVLLFKKGDTALPQNYRPISLLAVGYKVLAALIHRRLLQGGCEERMRPSQYGFRPGRGTADALMLARRMIDAAHLHNSGGLLFLLLDWAKAFDRIKTDSMMIALKRFGLPEAVISMIDGIYQSRTFVIRDHSGTSSERPQESGIAQGCPLSPYLFIIVQTVMLHDVFGSLDLRQEPEYIVTRDMLYADDTLLASSSADNLQSILSTIVEEGARYGLELNWSKTLQMRISTNAQVCCPSGEPIACVREAIYLGGLLTCDGRARHEVIRRLGEGRRLFDKLQKIWKHAGITRARKIRIYMACVISKLLYSMESIWLLKADRARLDAFHHRCLRYILQIRPSFISHVPNAYVLKTSGLALLSETLQQRQIALYVRIQNMPVDSYIRQLVCSPSGQPRIWWSRRGRGRPRQMWAHSVHNIFARNSSN